MEAEGRRNLGLQMERFEMLERRIKDGALVVREASTMWHDDEAEEYEGPSNLCMALISVAIDHLNAVRVLISGPQGVLPAMAGYTLLRSVVEASAMGLWMRSGGKRDKRVFFALRLLARQRVSADVFAKGRGLHHPAGSKCMKDRLLEIRNRTSYRTHDLDSFPKISDILRSIERLVPKGEYAPLAGWQAMSGIAHANRSVMLLVLEREPVGKGDALGSEYVVTSSVYVFAHMATLAVDCLEAFVNLVEQQSTTIEPQRRSEPKGR